MINGMLALIIVGSVLAVLVVAYFIILFVIYKLFLYTPHKNQNDEHNVQGVLKLVDPQKLLIMVDKMLSIPYQDFWTKSYDGLKLHAYFYENKKSNQYVILFNGYRGTPRRDFCARAMDLIKGDRNVILCDLRGHGLSEGHTISLGRKEQHDVVTWVNFVREKFGKDAKIAVGGTSLGGTTVLLASDKLPSDVKIFADSAYPGEKEMVKQIIRRKKLNPTFCWPWVYMAALVFGHTRFVDDTAENVSKSKCDILLVHCTADTLVPMELNKRLFEVNKEHVHLELYEGLQHASAYFQEHEKYEKMLNDFLDK